MTRHGGEEREENTRNESIWEVGKTGRKEMGKERKKGKLEEIKWEMSWQEVVRNRKTGKEN